MSEIPETCPIVRWCAQNHEVADWRRNVREACALCKEQRAQILACYNATGEACGMSSFAYPCLFPRVSAYLLVSIFGEQMLPPNSLDEEA